ncbi:MAG: GlgB N-terminal domain-containing protein, partial [Terriglobia bacterium]
MLTRLAAAWNEFPGGQKLRYDISLLTDEDLHLFNEGTHYRLYQKLGAHLTNAGGVSGTYFAVWAPNAEHVSVMGDFNGWDKTNRPLHSRGESGIWEGFVEGVDSGAEYKYQVYSRFDAYSIDKTDPLGFYSEVPPRTASIVWDLAYEWGDAGWMK